MNKILLSSCWFLLLDVYQCHWSQEMQDSPVSRLLVWGPFPIRVVMGDRSMLLWTEHSGSSKGAASLVLAAHMLSLAIVAPGQARRQPLNGRAGTLPDEKAATGLCPAGPV